MIPRYTRPQMGEVWSDRNKFQSWLEVELAAAESLAELGVVPAEDAAKLRKHASFDPERIFVMLKRRREHGCDRLHDFGGGDDGGGRGAGSFAVVPLWADVD